MPPRILLQTMTSRDLSEMQAFFIYHSRSETPKEQTPDEMKDIDELSMDITPGASQLAGFELLNGKGEKVNIYLDMIVVLFCSQSRGHHCLMWFSLFLLFLKKHQI